MRQGRLRCVCVRRHSEIMSRARAPLECVQVAAAVAAFGKFQDRAPYAGVCTPDQGMVHQAHADVGAAINDPVQEIIQGPGVQ